MYEIVGRLDSFILLDQTSNKICTRVYQSYKKLLNKRNFSVVATKAAANKLVYLKNSLASSKLANDERDYYYLHVHTMINVLMDALTLFVAESESTKPLKYINDNWPSLNEYWSNANRNTSLDDEWILSTIESSKQPRNFKLVYKMFVLCCVIRSQVLGQPCPPPYSHLPQFSSLYSRCLV